MKITYLLASSDITGGARVIFEHVNRLIDRGHRVHVVSQAAGQPEWFDLKTEVIPCSGDMASCIPPSDVVVATFFTHARQALAAKEAVCYYLVQGDELFFGEEMQLSERKRLSDESYRLPLKMLSVSGCVSRRLKEQYGRESVKIGNGVDVDLFSPRARKVRSTPGILVVGNEKLKFKGIDDIYRASKNLRSEGVEFELVRVSQTEFVNTDIPCEVIVRPSQEVLAQTYSDCDILVSGSHYESFSLPPLEAMACGTAVVTTDNEGVREYAVHGENALLVPVRDANAMAGAIRQLIECPELRQRLVKRGRETALERSWDRVIDRLEYTFEKDCHTRKRPRISLCMIVKNEEENIGLCLKNAAPCVDQMVVVDTGSVDRTVEIAEEHGATVYHHPWENDFARARNQSLSYATGDWVLCLDADEVLSPPNYRLLADAVVQKKFAGLYFNILSCSHDGVETFSLLSCRLFRNWPSFRFEGALHEQTTPSILKRGKIGRSEVNILHYGYLDFYMMQKDNKNRNIAILRQEKMRKPGDCLTLFNLGRQLAGMQRWQEAQHVLFQAWKQVKDHRLAYTAVLALEMASCLHNLGQGHKALGILNEALLHHPGFTDLVYARSVVKRGMGDLTGAAEDLATCVRMGDAPDIYPHVFGRGSFRALSDLGEIAAEIGNKRTARRMFERALQIHREHAPAAAGLVSLLLDIQPDVIEADLGSVIDLTSLSVRKAALSVLRAKGRLSLVGRYFPHEAKGTELALAMIRVGRYQEAWDTLMISPEEDAVRAPVFAICAAKGDAARCKELPSAISPTVMSYIRAMSGKLEHCAMFDGNTAAWALLSHLLELREFTLFERALCLAQRVFDDADLHVALSDLYRTHGYYESAVEEGLLAVRAGCKEPRIYRMLADAARQKGLHDDAELFNQAALELRGNRAV